MSNNVIKVLKFTFIQQLKNKTFKISTAIILLLVFIGTSLINFIPAISNKVDSSKSESEKNKIEITTLYYSNNLEFNADIPSIVNPIFKDLEVKEWSGSEEEAIEELKTTDKSEVFVSIDKVDEGVKVTLIRPKNSELVSSEDCDLVVSVLTSNLETLRLIDAGVQPEEIQDVMTPIHSEVLKAGENSKTFEEMIANTFLPMIICLIFFYIIYFFGYSVANSVVAEKTSRIMELLLTSVKPIQLLIGKCLTMGIMAMFMLVSIIVTAVASYEISGILVRKVIDSNAQTLDLSKVFVNISIIDLVWILIFFILGYILFSILNVLAGSTVSKIEDLQMAMMPTSFISVIGFYLAYFATFVNPESTLSKVAIYIPVSAPFYIPAALLSQDISVVNILISLAILIVSNILLIMFAAKVYSIAILHNGNRLKIKHLINIYKEG